MMTHDDTKKHKKTQENTGVGGNTRTPTPAVTSSDSVKNDEIDESKVVRTRKFCFTLNNYTDEEYSSVLMWCSSQKVYVIGKEGKGDGYTPHLQGYVETRNPVSFKTLKNKIGDRAHLEKKKWSEYRAIVYCMKEGDFVTNSDFRPIPKVKDPMEGLELYQYQKDIKKLIEEGGDNRKINWFWENEGHVGKSSFCKHLCLESPFTIILSGKGADMLNGVSQYIEKQYKVPKVVIIDIPRCVEHISWGGIEKLKDGCFYSGKYKGKMVLMNSPVVIVFSNNPPDKSKMSADRWNIQKINIHGADYDNDISDSDDSDSDGELDT